jgi:hypothetical protein
MLAYKFHARNYAQESIQHGYITLQYALSVVAKLKSKQRQFKMDLREVG